MVVCLKRLFLWMGAFSMQWQVKEMDDAITKAAITHAKEAITQAQKAIRIANEAIAEADKAMRDEK